MLWIYEHPWEWSEPRELSGQKNPRLGLPSLGYVPRPSKLGLREIEAALECPEDGNIGGLEALPLVPLLGVDMWLYPNSAETMKQRRRINRQPDMQQSASFNHSIYERHVVQWKYL